MIAASPDNLWQDIPLRPHHSVSFATMTAPLASASSPEKIRRKLFCASWPSMSPRLLLRDLFLRSRGCNLAVRRWYSLLFYPKVALTSPSHPPRPNYDEIV